MYEFKALTDGSADRFLPSVAMIFNGILLENEIEGYQTLTVEGRETINYDLDLAGSTYGRDGDILLSKSLPARVLRITYKLEAPTNEAFQKQFRDLGWLLQTTEDVKVRFRDDLTITYHGQLSEMSSIPPHSNNVIGSFTIYCSDPMKYVDQGTSTGNPTEIFSSTPYEMKPDEIKITMASNATKITIDNLNTGRHIILNGDYKIGDVILININGNIITKNNQNVMKELDYLESDFHKFTVVNGDNVLVTPVNSIIEIKTRGRWK